MDGYEVPEPCPECGDYFDDVCLACALLDALLVTAEGVL